MTRFERSLQSALARWGLDISEHQQHLLTAHFDAMIEQNRVMNLTRITDPAEAAVKHYADSLAPLVWARERNIAVRTVLDVGAGAGFPAVPLAAMRTDWSVTALDATRKKVDFLQRLADQVGLTNLRCVHGHSRHWKPETPFDLVVGRALAKLPEAVEQTALHVAPAGRLVLFKTASLSASELHAGRRTARRFRLEPDEPFPYELPAGRPAKLHRAERPGPEVVEPLKRILLIHRTIHLSHDSLKNSARYDGIPVGDDVREHRPEV